MFLSFSCSSRFVFGRGLPQAVRNAAAASMMASILATSTPALAEEAYMYSVGSVGKEMEGDTQVLRYSLSFYSRECKHLLAQPHHAHIIITIIEYHRVLLISIV